MESKESLALKLKNVMRLKPRSTDPSPVESGFSDLGGVEGQPVRSARRLQPQLPRPAAHLPRHERFLPRLHHDDGVQQVLLRRTRTPVSSVHEAQRQVRSLRQEGSQQRLPKAVR